MATYNIAKVGELKNGQMKKLELEGKLLLLVNAEEQFYVVDEMCSHEDYSLALGCIQNGRIKCSLHGSYFDLKTGAALVDPADEAIATYAVDVSGNDIQVTIDS